MPQRKSSLIVGREQLLGEITAGIADSGKAGAVLVGEPGIGKTALMQEVLQQLAPDFHTVSVRSSAFSARLPYGALSVLLAELGGDMDQHPVLIIRGLAELLKTQAEGRQIIFAVDNAEHLDSFSMTVLHQLVLEGTARLLLAARDFAEAPEEVIGLWREGSLHRFDVGPLTYAESRDYLTGELGQRVSRAAVDQLWASSLGNPLYLRMGCFDLKQAQRLILQDGVWVLAPGRVEPGRHTADALLSSLTDLTAGQMEVMEMLSLAGSLPLLLLLRISDDADVDRLQAEGLLSISYGSSPTAYIQHALLARTLAARISVGRRKALYNSLLAANPATDPPLDPSRRAEWISSYGGKVSPETALAAARLAVGQSQPALALDLLNSSDGPRTAALAVEAAKALRLIGDPTAAAQELASYWRQTTSPTLSDWTRLKMAESQLLQHTGRPGARQLLAEVEDRLERELPPASREQAQSPLWNELTLAQADLASFEGRFSDNATALASIYGAKHDKDINFRLQMGAWLCEAWAMTDQQEAARTLADELIETLPNPVVSRQTKERVHSHVGVAYRMTGAWPEYQRAFYAPEATDSVNLTGTAGELVDGLGHIYSDQPKLALEFLLPAVSQLKIQDPGGVLPLAAAAAAYCHAREGDVRGARLQLQYGANPEIGSWKIRREAAHFSAWATAEIDSSDKAISELQALSAEDRGRGISAYELIGLCSSLRLGDSSSIDRVLTLAGSIQGSYAKLCETYAKGLGNQESNLLVQAMEMATKAGNHVFAGEVGEVALQLVSKARDRSAIRHVRRNIRSTFAGVPGGVRDSRCEALTSREMEIAARAAAGISNRELAEEMCVSVRTIEGHLYRVFAKLCIDNRAELSAVLALESAAS